MAELILESQLWNQCGCIVNYVNAHPPVLGWFEYLEIAKLLLADNIIYDWENSISNNTKDKLIFSSDEDMVRFLLRYQ